ncbi:MAG: hypothetical protein K2H37_06535 [Lachnospiraceae bacterium]|nr:hypothetical protein [Lachnospiraceae bacterium]
MDSSRIYEYVMEPSEIREFCLTVYLEQLKYSKRTGVRLLLILAAELLFIPEAAAFTVLVLALMLLAVGIYNYAVTVKLLSGQQGSLWIEGGKLKARRRDYSEISCRHIGLIRKTKHLLLLGYMQGVRRPAWFVIPLRVFGDGQELDLFLSMLRRPQAQEECLDHNSQQNVEAEFLRFSYRLDGERWVRLQKGAADLINGGSLGRTARLYCRDPEKAIRKQLKSPEIAARACGLWQISLAENGVSVTMPADLTNTFAWTSLAWLLETEEAFYLFHRDKKHFVMIAKESFLSWDQVHLFHRICADHGIQKNTSKKARYVPGWLVGLLFGLFLLVCAGIFTVKIFLDSRSTPGSVLGDTYGRVPLEEQVEVLSSLGLHVPEETVESVRSSMVEYGLYDLVEESPYTWLLTDMGAPAYDEEWNLTGYSEEVFWFDFEGFDISTDYIDVLNGMLALAQGSALDGVSDIRENTEDVNWERGRGTAGVSLVWKEQTYSYDMEVYNDWIDGRVLGIFNPLLEQEGSRKYFYAAGDNGQGAIVFFCTPEWAEQFTQKTGLALEKSTAKADEVRQAVD